MLIGQNGVGKSNFISLFKFIERLVEQQLSDYIFKSGGINHFLFNGFEKSEFIQVDFSVHESHSDVKWDFYGFRIDTDGESYRIVTSYETDKFPPTSDELFLIGTSSSKESTIRDDSNNYEAAKHLYSILTI